MSMIRQACPGCGRNLELPATAVGRLAKCPACEVTFTVEGPSAPEIPPTPTIPPTSHSPQEPFGQASRPFNPYADEASDYQNVGPASPNPYEPSTASAPTIQFGNVTIMQRSIEEIISTTWSVFKAHWVPVVVAPLLVGMVAFVLIFIPILIFAAVAEAGGDALLLILFLVMFPFLFLLGAYVTVGLTRVMIAAARNEPSPLGQLVAPLGLSIRFIGMVLLLFLFVGGIGLVLGGGFVGLAAALGGQEGASFGAIVVGIVLMGVMVVLQFLVWPAIYLISDDKATAYGSLTTSWHIVMHNKGTSVMLILVSMVLSMIGSTICYVGQIVTTPATMLLFAIAYLLMTNQPVSVPPSPAPRVN